MHCAARPAETLPPCDETKKFRIALLTMIAARLLKTS
jgi:hypothetical protein